jgi:hypothetical protein
MPEPIMSQGQSKLPLLILSVVVAAVAGFAVGWQSGSSKAAKASYDEGYATARAEDTAKLESLGFIRPTMEEEGEMLSLSGTVSAVGANSFDLLVSITPASPLDEVREYPVKVNVDAETKISLQSRVNEEDFMAAMEKFQDAMRAQETAGGAEEENIVEPPSMYKTVEIKLTDLAVGMSVSIETATDARDQSEVIATGVTAREMEPEEIVPEGSAGDEEPMAEPESI